MTKPSEVILRVKKNIGGIEKEYVKSKEFQVVAENALIDFIKRVQRGFLPTLGKIPGFSEKYLDLRKKNKSNLGDQAKPNKSNATATGQMLGAMTFKMKPNGFQLFVQSNARSKELSNSQSKLNNSEVAKYYSEKRDVFEFSEPELQRIVRRIKTDLLDIVRRLK